MADETLDVTGLQCPLPVLRLRKRLAGLAPGTLVELVATDPATRIDVPHFCAEQGHVLVGQSVEGEIYRYTVRRA